MTQRVGTNRIANTAVSGLKLAENSVRGNNIVVGTITANKVESNPVFTGNVGLTGVISAYNQIGSNIAITNTYTLGANSFGNLHFCSGTTANYTLTLPAVTGNTGKLITFQMSNTLTKLVTLDGNGSEMIDGALTRIMWANESCVLYCDGSAWRKVGGRTIPMNVLLYKTGGNQSVSSATATKLTLQTVDANNAPAAMYDTSLSRINIVRPGLYQMTHSGRITNISTSTNSETLGYKNGAEYAITSRYMTTGDWGSCQFSMLVNGAVGDYFETYVRQYSGVNQNFYSGDLMSSIYAIEIPQW